MQRLPKGHNGQLTEPAAKKHRSQVYREGKMLVRMVDDFLNKGTRSSFDKISFAACVLRTFIHGLEFRSSFNEDYLAPFLPILDDVAKGSVDGYAATEAVSCALGPLNQSLSEVVGFRGRREAEEESAAEIGLPPGKQIYSVFTYFVKPVLAVGGGYGITKEHITSAIAESAQDAEEKARAHYEARGAEIDKMVVTLASNQRLQGYLTPEWMIGYADDVMRPPVEPYRVSVVSGTQYVKSYNGIDEFAKEMPALDDGHEFYVESQGPYLNETAGACLRTPQEVLDWLSERGIEPATPKNVMSTLWVEMMLVGEKEVYLQMGADDYMSLLEEKSRLHQKRETGSLIKAESQRLEVLNWIIEKAPWEKGVDGQIIGKEKSTLLGMKQ